MHSCALNICFLLNMSFPFVMNCFCTILGQQLFDEPFSTSELGATVHARRHPVLLQNWFCLDFTFSWRRTFSSIIHSCSCNRISSVMYVGLQVREVSPLKIVSKKFYLHEHRYLECLVVVLQADSGEPVSWSLCLWFESQHSQPLAVEGFLLLWIPWSYQMYCLVGILAQ